ncbi:hypothetical protein CL630_02715 [bacterium]|nr:hypothetical protein [bacterium]
MFRPRSERAKRFATKGVGVKKFVKIHFCDTVSIMNIVTIPKKLAGKDDLIVIPRKEYETLLQMKRIKEFTPTSAEKKALVKAENNFKKGKTLSYNELVKKLEA